AIDPTNPNNMVIGWRQFNSVTSNFRQAGYGYTTDGGQTWWFPGVIDPGVFHSDPVLSADAEGNFYYNSLEEDFTCYVYKSSFGGAIWDGGTFAHGGDKQWMVVDKTNSIGKGNQYAFWTSAYSTCLPGFFTRSTDQGESFEDCTEIPDSPFWGTQAISQTGTLYVCGWGDTSFVVARSSTVKDSSMSVSWDTVNTVSLDGGIAYGTSPNPGGLAGQTWLAVDNSNGPWHGYVYLLCSVQRYSNSDPLDVMFARSSDGGVTWSSPVRVNDDTSTTNYQWFGTMSVAPNGRIDVVWLDTRDNPGTVLSSLYYSFSIDGGATWSPNERLTQAFDPHVGWPQQNKMGDYYHMISDNNGAHLAFSATFNGEEDVYYGHINESAGTNERSISVNAKWNLISLPMFVEDSSRTTLFPTATSKAFLYQGNSYVEKDTLAPGFGYWLNFANQGSISISGVQITAESVAVQEGWNMIGSVSNPLQTRSVTSSPSGITTSKFFGYNGRYITSDTIYPGQGYWVKVNQNGILILSTVSNTALAKNLSTARIRIVPTDEFPPPPPHSDGTTIDLPKEFALEQNYPNPFNPTTTLRYALPTDSRVTLGVYNVLGQVVSTLVDGVVSAGYQSAEWNANGFASGIYFYRIEATSIGNPSKTFIRVKKMVLMK
ncbi:MAG TPA: T9SS type A sorting domain-containing protein, partial [Bacteroidota bacterium]|nr:T9SS type A sorting domain-containing protein [Bacteroidota bacterium]